MSQEIDQRVVEMRFDNAQFEEKSRKTMRTLDKLREKLRFDGAEKGIEKVQEASDNVDFSGMEKGLDRVQEKFSALDVIAFTTLQNITNRVTSAGEQMVKSLSLDQVTSGWDKYVEKTGNVQTIMNATGKSIDQVNGYLNKLMWYSDETSYSFDEMTSALSQMTASGGNIEKMIPMIMGIANATADAGKTGFAFQSTIRNLTQSYSAGHLQLQDWKSLNLMGTATKALKQELIETAEELGVIKKGDVTIASFESSLSKKWANTTVMEKTFSKYASMMEAAYDLTQKEGITSSEALERLKGQYGEIAERAALAAQQATSFSQAIDSTKDAVSSKWMSVFETIFGNKEEATKTWTELANRLYDVFVPGVEAMNERLREGLDSGWEQLRRRFGDQADLYATALEKVALSSGAVSEQAIEEAGSFAEALKQGKVDANLLGTSLNETIASYERMLATVSEDDPRYSYIQKDYEAFLKLNEAVEDGSLDLGHYADKMTEVSGREHLMQSLWNIWDAIAKVMGTVHDAFTEIFPPTSGEQIHSIAEGLDVMTGKLILSDKAAEKLKKTFKGVFSVIKVPLTAITTLVKTGAKAFEVLVDVLRPVGGIFLEVGAGMGDFLEEMQETLLGTGKLSDKLESITNSTKKLLHPLTTLGEVLKTSIGSKLSAMRDEISKWSESLPEGAQAAVNGLLSVLEGVLTGGLTLSGAVWSAISGLKKKLMGALSEVAAFVTGQQDTLMGYTDVIAQLPAIVGSAVTAFADEFKGAAGNVEKAADSVFTPVKAFFTALKDGFESISGTDVYRFLSLVDVGLLGYAFAQFGKAISSATSSLKKMLETPLTELLNSISGSFKGLTSALKTWQKQENTKILTGMASALLMLAGAMFVMSKIDPKRFLEVAVVTGVLIAELATVAKLLKPEVKAFDSAVSGLGSQVLKASTLWGVAASLLGLAVAVKAVCGGFTAIMEVLKGENFYQNLGGFATVIMGMVVLIQNLGRLTATLKMENMVVGGKTLIGMGASLIEMGIAMKIVASAVEPLSKIKLTSLVKAVGSLAVLSTVLVGMGAAMVGVQRLTDTTLIFQNGAAIAAMAGGLLLVAAAVSILADIETDKLENAMTSMKTLIVLMTALSVLSSKTGIGSGAAVLAMAAAMQVVTTAALSLTLVPWESLGKAAAVLGGLTAAMAILSGFSALMAKFGAKGGGISQGLGMIFMATAMLEMAAAILAVAGAVWVFAKAPWPGMIYAAGALVALSVAAGLLSNFAGSANVLSVGIGMQAMAVALLLLAPAIRLLGEADPEHVANAMWAFATGMMAVFVGGMILTCIPELAVGLKVLADAFKDFGKGLMYLAGGTALLGVLALFADPLCQAIINAAPDIEDALVAVVTLICDVLNRCTEPLGEALATVMKVLIQTAIDLIGWAWDGGDTGNGGIKGALEELFSNIVDWIKNKLIPFQNGAFQQRDIALHFNPDFKAERVSIFDVFNFSSTDKEAEDEGKKLGGNITKGGKKGIEEGSGEVVAATESTMNAVVDKGKDVVQSHSPSKVFEEIGRYITEGLAIGIQDEGALNNAKTAMHNVATAIREVFTTYWGIHSPSDLAMSDAENILEGALLGIGDKEKREQLRAEAYNTAAVIASGIQQAMDEAISVVQMKGIELYDAYHNAVTFGLVTTKGGAAPYGYQSILEKDLGQQFYYNNRYKELKADFEKTMETPLLIPGKNGITAGLKDTETESFVEKVKAGILSPVTASLQALAQGGKVFQNKVMAALGDVVGLKPGTFDIDELTKEFMSWYDKYLPDDPTTNPTDPQKPKSSGKGKTLAETIAEKYSKELKANKYLQDAASKEYTLWENAEGDTASIEALIEKKGESLATSIELQTARVEIAQRQYDELLSRVGADDDKTKDARATLLDEKNTLAELRKQRYETLYKTAIERYENDDELAQSEYQLWADTYEKTASVTEKNNKEIEQINKRLATQSAKTALAEKAWIETRDALGEASAETQARYLEYLKQLQAEQELKNELAEAQLDLYDKLDAEIQNRMSAAKKRQSLLDKLYNDGDLASRESAYESAVEQYGEDSLEARRAATQGTMSALMGVASAMNNLQFQMKALTNAQNKYDAVLEQVHGDRNNEQALAAYGEMLDARSDFADYMGNLADAFDVSDGAKRAMMQAGDALAKNWKEIQNGMNKVLAKVNPQVADSLKNVVGLYMREGASETMAATANAIVAAMSGDWAQAVASGLAAVLDIVGTDFGKTLTEAISSALKLAFNSNDLFVQLLTQFFGSNSSSGGSSGNWFSNIINWGKELLGLSSGLDATMTALNTAGAAGAATGSGLVDTMANMGVAARTTTKVVAGAGGLTKVLGSLGTTLGSVGTSIAGVASSLGPHGLLIGAVVAGGALIISNWDKVKEAVGNAWDWIKEKASGLWDGLKGFVGGAVEAGSNLVGGLWNGIKSVAGGLWDGVKSVCSGILDGVLGFFGIHSPSRVMAQVGVYIGEGLTNGIVSTGTEAEKGMDEVGSAVLESAHTVGQHIADFMAGDDSSQPTIRPVVDLSEAAKSSAWLNSAFADRRGTISMAATVSGQMARQMGTATKIQNGAERETTKPQSNRDVVEAVNALGERIDGIARAVSSMKVELNGKKLVGGIKSDMNAALGSMAR